MKQKTLTSTMHMTSRRQQELIEIDNRIPEAEQDN